MAGTLRTIAGVKGSQVVFDFALPSTAISEQERASRERLAAQVAKAREPWINYYSPGPLAEELRASGYSAARTLGSDEMNELYFRNRTDGFRLYGSGQIMTAQV